MKNQTREISFRTLILLFLIGVVFNPLQSSGTNRISIIGEKERTVLYKKGIEALDGKDTVSAEKYFIESISRYGDAASHYELAKINLSRKTFTSRNKAYENLRRAVLKEPDNLEYRYAFANLMRDFARLSSFDEYKKIISIDSTQVEAWLNLGELKAEDFKEFNNSVRDMGEIYGSLQEFALQDFYESEKYFLTALEKDPLHYNTLLKLSLLYENAGVPQKGIPLLERLIKHNKDDKEIYLCIGLLYYKTSKIKEAHREYKKALDLMSETERKDFTFNSVKLFLESSFEEVFKNYSEEELNEFVNVYWKISDPLYLTEYNERLLEHYSRVAYANLNFSIPSMGIVGWKSNMGETILRYGEPQSRMRIRPQIGDNGSVGMKTEVWNYPDMTFAFTDMASSGNYQYVWPAAEKDKLVPQVPGNYHDYAEYLRKERPTYYNPKFEGPKIDVPYSFIQFKSNKRNHTDLYLNYSLSVDDSLFASNEKVNHRVGFYFFNEDYEEQFSRIVNTMVDRNSKFPPVQNLLVNAIPDSGFSSFEIIRDVDNGTLSSRTPLKIRKFSNNRTDISDIVLAYDITNSSTNESYIKRENVYVKPNPTNVFTKSLPIYIYYELYNLQKDEKGLTDFEQNVIISPYQQEEKSGFGKFISSALSFLGIISDDKITLTSNYRTIESDPQIYFQLDFSNYEPGDYLITMNVKDRISGNNVEIKKVLKWNIHANIFSN
ncbi:MAG: GWxTD domain-containing protein [Melioribacteraceae bacterium]|nr:GWxTD domain-containing protein [Melioribacteraceae bacterium]